MGTYFEKKYCNTHLCNHWLELQRKPDGTDREICRGETFTPANTETHYTRRLGHGIELIKKSKLWQPEPEPLPLDWKMAIEARQDVVF